MHELILGRSNLKTVVVFRMPLKRFFLCMDKNHCNWRRREVEGGGGGGCLPGNIPFLAAHSISKLRIRSGAIFCHSPSAGWLTIFSHEISSSIWHLVIGSRPHPPTIENPDWGHVVVEEEEELGKGFLSL